VGECIWCRTSSLGKARRCRGELGKRARWASGTAIEFEWVLCFELSLWQCLLGDTVLCFVVSTVKH